MYDTEKDVQSLFMVDPGPLMGEVAYHGTWARRKAPLEQWSGHL